MTLHDGVMELVPDVIRMRERFELTNGASEVSDENMQMRAMSYCMQLGPLKAVNELIQQKKWPVRPVNWYNANAMVKANMAWHHTSDQQVMKNVSWLIEMLKQQHLYEHTFKTWSSKKMTQGKNLKW
jgi:hypothetical protein